MDKIKSYGALGTMACSFLLLISVFIIDGLTQNSSASSVAIENSSLAVQPGLRISMGLLGEIIGISALVVSGVIALGQIISGWLKNRRYDKEWGYSLK
jgi:hypothetical protein